MLFTWKIDTQNLKNTPGKTRKKRRAGDGAIPEKWVTDAEAGELLGFTRLAIHEWRQQYPGAPKRRKDGRCKLTEFLFARSFFAMSGSQLINMRRKKSYA